MRLLIPSRLIRTSLFYLFVTCASALPVQNGSVVIEPPPSNVYGKGEPRQGWTSSPNNRGTSDILWAALTTSFLCCWSMLCLNVSGRTDTTWIIFRRKLFMALATLFAPECICVVAAAQYLSARQSVKEFSAAGISDWKMRHAFIADMGGFVLQTRDWVPFPINAKQLLWLIQSGYLSVPRTEMKIIRDKNKVDGMMRFVMVVQATWFCINITGRLVQGLAITVIEVSTVAFIYCGLFIMFFWRHKPADVGTAEVLRTDATMAEILLKGGDATLELYRQTPLDFISRKEWAWSKLTISFLQALQKLNIPVGSRSLPVDHFSNVTAPEIPFWIVRIGLLGVMGYACLYVPPWKSSFPTDTEQLLWRIAVVFNIIVLLLGELLIDWSFHLWPYIKSKWVCRNGTDHSQNHTATLPNNRRSHRLPQNQTQVPPESRAIETKRSRPTVWDLMRNNSAARDPSLTIPLKAAIPFWTAIVIYPVCRTFILVEIFLELRSLPLSAYETVQWSEIMPYFS